MIRMTIVERAVVAGCILGGVILLGGMGLFIGVKFLIWKILSMAAAGVSIVGGKLIDVTMDAAKADGIDDLIF